MAAQPIIEASPEDLSISTEVCPHCGRPRRSVIQRTGGISRCMTSYWQVEWICGSYVILSAQPRLSLSKGCRAGDFGGYAPGDH